MLTLIPVEVLAFLDGASRESLRLVSYAHNELFKAHFKCSPPIGRACKLIIAVAGSTIDCFMVYRKTVKVPDYFHHFQQTDLSTDSGNCDSNGFRFLLQSEADFEGVLLDGGAHRENVLLRIFGSGLVSFRTIVLSIKAHRLPTNKPTLSILHHWRHLWADSLACDFFCNYADAFGTNTSCFSSYAQVVATLPPWRNTWITCSTTGSGLSRTIPYKTLFDNILSYLRMEANFYDFTLGISVKEEGTASLEESIKTFTERVSEVPFPIALTPSELELHRTQLGSARQAATHREYYSEQLNHKPRTPTDSKCISTIA